MENLSIHSFAEITTPPTTIVGGVELYSFCLGHWMNLEKIDSPFLPGSKKQDVSIGDLLLFVLVCGQTHEGGSEMLSDFLIFDKLKKQYEKHLIANLLFGKHRILNWLALIKIRNTQPFNSILKKLFKSYLVDSKWNLRNEMFNISEYLKYFMQMPEFDEKKERGMPSGIDWRQNIYTILKNEYNYSETIIMNMPLKRVFFEWCGYAEKMDSIRVNNSHDILHKKMVDEYNKNLVKEMKEKQNAN